MVYLVGHKEKTNKLLRIKKEKTKWDFKIHYP